VLIVFYQQNTAQKKRGTEDRLEVICIQTVANSVCKQNLFQNSWTLFS